MVMCCVSSIYNRMFNIIECLYAFVFYVVELLEDFCVRSRCQKADNDDADQADNETDQQGIKTCVVADRYADRITCFIYSRDDL